MNIIIEQLLNNIKYLSIMEEDINHEDIVSSFIESDHGKLLQQEVHEIMKETD